MKKRGFTLLELLLSLTIFSVIIGAVTGVFLSSQRTKQRVDQLVQAQQSARTAIDYMIKDLRAAGYNIDIDESMTSTPQRRIVYASAYEVVFNANILPSEDSPDSPLEPSAMKVTPTERPAHYYPVTKYNTGAETVVFTLDWDNDGLINANDRDGSPAIFTDNPNDYCLIKRVYGEWDDGSNIKTLVEGIEGWTNQEVVSIVAGPDRYPSQSEGTPIFGYWIDNDGDPVTPPELFGDTDGDGELSEAEGNSLSPITNYEILDKIELITVNVTGVSQSPFQGEYTETSIKTDVSVTRNVSIKVFLAKGHVYLDENTDGIYDTGEPGLENMKVRLSTGETSITDENGIWTFAIIPGTYGVSVSPDILYRGTTALNFDFTVKNESADFTLDSVYKNFFGMDSTPSANIKGVIFHDLNSDGLWQTEDEPGLSDIQVSVWNNNTSSVSSPADSVGTYDLLANAEETLYVWVIPPDSFASSGVDIIDQLGYTTGSPVVSALSTSAAMVYMQEAEVSYVAFGLLAATGTRPTVQVISPNGGEIYTTGSMEYIKVYANPNDSGEVIKKLSFFFSVDGGEHYTPIGEVPYPTMVNDSYSFLWNIPLELQGSQICLVRVAATDDGNWTVSDDSDNYFTIVAEGGYTSLFFTNEYVDSLKDDSLYIFAFANSYPAAMGNTGPLPRYLNTVNSRTLGVVSDSLPDSDSTYYAPLPLWTQFSQRAEFVTVKGMPYADTIWPGWWTFYVYGNTDADTSRSENRSFDFEVFKVDSFGHRNTAVKLFSTYEPWLYDAVYKTSFNNWEEEETVKVFINHPFSIDIHDRLYVKCYYSGTFTNTGGPSGDISPKVYMTFGEFRNTRVVLPPKP